MLNGNIFLRDVRIFIENFKYVENILTSFSYKNIVIQEALNKIRMLQLL